MKVLIVKIGAIGDVILAMSMIDAVRRQNPGAHLTWLCGRSVQPLLEAHGGIDEIIAVDDAGLLRGSPLRRLSCVGYAWRRLFGRSFDRIVTGHSDWRYRVLAWTARGRVRRSFGVHAGRVLPAPGRWHADEYARLVTGDASFDAAPARLSASPAVHDRELLERLASPGPPWVALAPGGARNLLRDDALRRWPIEHYAALADRLLHSGWRVLVTGGAGDEWVREHFASLAVTDAIGRTSLVEQVAVYERCSLVVTHDSGPMHLAGLARVPVLALFGPTTPQEKVPPDGSIRVLWGGSRLACRPCYDGHDYAACGRNVCLEEIDVETVHQAVVAISKSAP